MSVTNRDIKNEYVSAGEKVFPISFPFWEENEITVFSLNEETLEEMELLNGKDYSVKINREKETSFIELTEAGLAKIPAGNTVTLIRKIPLTQETSIMENDPFYTSTIEKMADKLTYIALGLQEELSRAIKYPIGLKNNPGYAELEHTVSKAAAAVKQAAEAAQTIESGKNQTIQAAQTAMKWATNPENVPVEEGKYSAYHYAMQLKNSVNFATEEEAIKGVEPGKAVSPGTLKPAAMSFLQVDFRKKQRKSWNTVLFTDKNGILIFTCIYGSSPDGAPCYLDISFDADMNESFTMYTADCLYGAIQQTIIIPIWKNMYYLAGGGISSQKLYFIPLEGEL